MKRLEEDLGKKWIFPPLKILWSYEIYKIRSLYDAETDELLVVGLPGIWLGVGQPLSYACVSPTVTLND